MFPIMDNVQPFTVVEEAVEKVAEAARGRGVFSDDVLGTENDFVYSAHPFSIRICGKCGKRFRAFTGGVVASPTGGALYCGSCQIKMAGEVLGKIGDIFNLDK